MKFRTQSVFAGSLALLSAFSAFAADPAPMPLPSPGAEARVFYVGTIGRSGDADARDPEYWLKHELDDWKDPQTGTTLMTTRQCGAALKFRLLGTKRRNFVEVEASATAGNPLEFDPSKVRMIFGSRPGEEREAKFVFEPGTLELEPGDSVYAAVPFPDKSDFSGESEIKVRVQLGKCTAETVFKRPADQSEIAASRLVWTGMQLGVEFGGSLAKTGHLKDVTDNGIDFKITVTHYPWLRHGFWAGIEFESLGKSGATGIGSGVSGLGAFLGYSFRQYLADRWSFHVDLAPGIYEFASAQTAQGLRSLDHAFVLGQRIGLDWVFGRLDEPDFLDSDHAVGVLLSGDWFPGASIGGTSASGYSFSLQGRYLFGI